VTGCECDCDSVKVTIVRSDFRETAPDMRKSYCDERSES